MPRAVSLNYVVCRVILFTLGMSVNGLADGSNTNCFPPILSHPPAHVSLCVNFTRYGAYVIISHVMVSRKIVDN